MGYGPKKLNTKEIGEAVGEVIKDAILKRIMSSSPFNNSSLAFVGVKFIWSCAFELQARELTETEVSGAGEVRMPGEEYSQVTETLPAETVGGKHAAGKAAKPKAKKAENAPEAAV